MPPWVMVADLLAPALDPADRHHVERVLRVRSGDQLTVTDGTGRIRPCRLAAAGRLDPVGEVEAVPALAPPLTVAIAITKGARPETAVQKLTELGIDRIVPFHAARSVARWADDGARHLARLRRVAREAALQSQRARLPEVTEVATFMEVACLPGAAIADRLGDPPSLDRPVLLIGPEGGWAPEELSFGLPQVSFGPQVLRVETAAMAGSAILAALRNNSVVARGRSSA